MNATKWSDADMAQLLPTGTVTLLLADVEGDTAVGITSRVEVVSVDRLVSGRRSMTA